MKRCSRCKRELSEDNFYKNKTKADGLNNECKACSRLSVSRAKAKYSASATSIKTLKEICRKVIKDPDIDTILDLYDAVETVIDNLALERTE